MLIETVEIAQDADTALKKIVTTNYDLFLIDVQMPVMDGLEASRRIRTWEAGKVHVPIIAMTAHVFPEDRKRCKEAGMDDFLAKPFTIENLDQVLCHWLNNN